MNDNMEYKNDPRNWGHDRITLKGDKRLFPEGIETHILAEVLNIDDWTEIKEMLDNNKDLEHIDTIMAISKALLRVGYDFESLKWAAKGSRLKSEQANNAMLLEQNRVKHEASKDIQQDQEAHYRDGRGNAGEHRVSDFYKAMQKETMDKVAGVKKSWLKKLIGK